MGDNPQHVIKQPKKGVGGWKKGWKEGTKDLGYYEKGCHLSLPPPNISSLRLFCGVARYTEEGWGEEKGGRMTAGVDGIGGRKRNNVGDTFSLCDGQGEK